MLNERGRYISGAITETGRYNSAVSDETGVYGISASNIMVGSGGAIAGGTALITFLFVMHSSGGAIAGGAAPQHTTRLITASGGAVAGGTASISSTFRLTAKGGAIAGGAAPQIKFQSLVPKGGAVASGTAKTSRYATIPGLPPGAALCTLETTPPQTFTMNSRLLSVGTIRKPMGGIIGNLENANASITLDNSDGTLTTLFSPPPIGLKVSLATNTYPLNVVFTGIITSVSIGQIVTLQLEAGERIPLTAKVPLVSTTQLPGYRVDKSIPIVYGTVTLEPIAADSNGYIFIAAGHPAEAIEAVYIDNMEAQAWSWKNSQNSAGTMATITLSKALATNEKLTCRLRGKQNPRTGALLTNPADIIWDILSNVSGIALDYAELDHFRAEMLTQGMALSGAITDATRTIRSIVDEIATSCGSIWSGQASGIALKYLGRVPEVPEAIITANQITGIKIDTALSSIATALKLTFAYSYSQGQATKTALFESANSIKRYGRTSVELAANWLSSSRNAAIMGEQYLAWKATPQWDISIETGGEYQSITPGQWITVNHPYLPGGSVTALCTNAELDITNGNITIQISAPADDIQAVTLTGLSSAFDPQTMQGTQIQFANGQARLTFVNDKGQPLAGAKVTLDGSQTKTTDKAGQVTFTTARGTHSIKVEATGYAIMQGEIEI